MLSTEELKKFHGKIVKISYKLDYHVGFDEIGFFIVNKTPMKDGTPYMLVESDDRLEVKYCIKVRNVENISLHDFGKKTDDFIDAGISYLENYSSGYSSWFEGNEITILEVLKAFKDKGQMVENPEPEYKRPKSLLNWRKDES